MAAAQEVQCSTRVDELVCFTLMSWLIGEPFNKSEWRITLDSQMTPSLDVNTVKVNIDLENVQNAELC